MNKKPKAAALPVKIGRRAELVGGAIVVVAAFAMTLVLVAMSGLLVCEDAMIYLRYARNLAEGRGLVYNPGEYYESNTNFMWSILLAPAFVLGIDPVAWFRFAGLFAAAVVIAMVYVVARQIGTRRDAVFAAALIGSHSSFAAFAVNGFAPHLPPLFALAAAAFAFAMAKTGRALFAAGTGLCLFLLMLTRLDAAIFALPVGLFALWAAWQHHNARVRNLALSAVLPAGLFAVYLAVKYHYYGDIFPATYYVKAVIPEQLKEWYDATGRGMRYTWLYARQYWFVFVAPFVLWGAHRAIGKKGRRVLSDLNNWGAEHFLLLFCAACAVLWFAYILRTGGGYYEFRFWVTGAPFVFILVARALRGLSFSFSAPVVCILAAASFWHAAHYDKDARLGNDGIAYALKSSPAWCPASGGLEEYKNRWASLGNFFTADFGNYSPEVKMATGAGGFLPYYSRLHTLEMRGWTDTRVLEPGNHILVGDPLPGHQHLASPKLFSDLGIHIVIGDSFIVESGDEVLSRLSAKEIIMGRRPEPYLGLLWQWDERMLKDFPPDAKLVELPAGGKKLFAIYWTRSQKLDAFFARNNIALHDIAPNADTR